MNTKILTVLCIFTAAVVSLGLTVSANADLLYGIDVDDEAIFTLDTDTGDLIKYYGHPFVGCPQVHGGLDFDSQGNLYLEQYGLLYLIDLANPLNDHEIGSCNDLDFECFEIIGDTGYGQGGSDGFLYTIDLSTNVATQLPIPTDPDCPPCHGRVTGLASTDEAGAVMYGARITPSDIIEIDPMTGENLGTVFSGPLPDYITSLAYGSSGNLWYIPALERALYSIDLNTGTYQEVFWVDVFHCTGLTSAPMIVRTENMNWGQLKQLYR